MLFYRPALPRVSHSLYLLLPFSYIQAWSRRYDYDLSYVTRNWVQRHTEYFLVLALWKGHTLSIHFGFFLVL